MTRPSLRAESASSITRVSPRCRSAPPWDSVRPPFGAAPLHRTLRLSRRSQWSVEIRSVAPSSQREHPLTESRSCGSPSPSCDTSANSLHASARGGVLAVAGRVPRSCRLSLAHELANAVVSVASSTTLMVGCIESFSIAECGINSSGGRTKSVLRTIRQVPRRSSCFRAWVDCSCVPPNRLQSTGRAHRSDPSKYCRRTPKFPHALDGAAGLGTLCVGSPTRSDRWRSCGGHT